MGKKTRAVGTSTPLKSSESWLVIEVDKSDNSYLIQNDLEGYEMRSRGIRVLNGIEGVMLQALGASVGGNQLWVKCDTELSAGQTYKGWTTHNAFKPQTKLPIFYVTEEGIN